MTKKEIKHRRYLNQIGNKRVIKIEKIKTKHHAIGLIIPMVCFSYWERIKSLFTFKIETLPTELSYKGRIMPLIVLKN
jgi:hypothetical protein